MGSTLIADTQNCYQTRNLGCTSALESPRFVIVAFWCESECETKIDPTLLDNINISNIRLCLNRDYWQKLCKFLPELCSQETTYSSRLCCIQYSLIVCFRREDSMKFSTVNIKLDIEAGGGFCLIIYDCLMEYLSLGEIFENWSQKHFSKRSSVCFRSPWG